MNNKDSNEEIKKEIIDIDNLMNDGWVLRDVPWTTIDNFKRLIDVCGENETFILATSTVSNKSNIIRGQVLFSPAAMKRMINWIKENENNG